MLLPTRADWIKSAAGMVLAMLVFAGYLAVRSGNGLTAALAHWDQVLAVGVLAGNGIVCALWLLRLRYHQTLRALAKFVIEYKHNPTSTSGPLQQQLRDTSPDLSRLADSLDGLCSSYRQALADRVVHSAALESLRSLLGRVDPERPGPPGASFRGNTTSRDMVARFTPNLYWLTATPSLQQFLGCQMAELNGRPFADLIHPDDLANAQQAFQTALQTGEAHNITFRLRIRQAPSSKESGHSGKRMSSAADAALEVRHVQVDMLTRYNETLVPLHIRCYLVDITDKIRSENELRRRTRELSETNERLRQINMDLQRLKESYRDLYHNAPVMYFSLDANGHFVTFNDTILDTLGYSRDELFKQPYTRLLTSESQKRFLQDPTAYQKAGEVETQWLKKNGTVIDIWVRSTPVQDETGEFVRSRSVAQDVTERNRLASELRRRGDELERANAELLKINNALDEFTGAVAHDLKEPLRTVESYSHFLAEEYVTELGPEGASYLDFLVKASRRLSNLIEDLLVLAQAGRITRELTAFDLGETVATVCNDLDALIQRSDASVVVVGTLPRVYGDSPRVTQLLSNLITNGIKYNTSATPRITIGVRSATTHSGQTQPPTEPRDERTFVTVYVADNGIGIDPAFHDEIFGVFRRLHDPDKYEGTGAGLAIVKKVVEAHDGQIWVESQPGQGSTFLFTLPLAASPDSTAASAASPSRHAGTAPITMLDAQSRADNGVPIGSTAVTGSEAPAFPAATILLVEDMPEIALIAQKLTRRAGYDVHWVTSAEAGWEYLEQHRPELVLLDIHLPGMSGVDLCKMLRATPRLQDLTIALFSQLEQPEAQAAGRSVGADFVLSKDLLCRASVWQRKLDEILSASKVRA